MNANLATLVLVGCGVLNLAAGAEGWRRDRGGPPRVVLFERPNYRGAALELEIGSMLSDLATLRFPNGARVNDNVSSLVVERGMAVRFYVDDQFGGEFLEIARDVDDLATLARCGNAHWSDAISSLRVIEARPGAGRDRDPSRRPRVIVFRYANYRGEAFEIFPGEKLEDLNRERFESGEDLNEEIASIRVVGPVRVRLFLNARFRGESVELTGDVADLARVKRVNKRDWWRNQTSSLQVEWIDPARAGEPGADDGRGGNRNDRDDDDRGRGRSGG